MAAITKMEKELAEIKHELELLRRRSSDMELTTTDSTDREKDSRDAAHSLGPVAPPPLPTQQNGGGSATALVPGEPPGTKTTIQEIVVPVSPVRHDSGLSQITRTKNKA